MRMGLPVADFRTQDPFEPSLSLRFLRLVGNNTIDDLRTTLYDHIRPLPTLISTSSPPFRFEFQQTRVLRYPYLVLLSPTLSSSPSSSPLALPHSPTLFSLFPV